jgi:hypothetical protein
MSENRAIRAARFLKSVGQHGEASGVDVPRGQTPLVVGDLSEGSDGRRPPRRVEGDGAERVAEDVPDDLTLQQVDDVSGLSGEEVERPQQPGILAKSRS